MRGCRGHVEAQHLPAADASGCLSDLDGHGAGAIEPAIAFSQSVRQYFGTLQGTEPNSTLLVTKSLTGNRNGTEVHFNLSYRHHFDGASDDRDNRTRLVVGVSQPLSEKLTILADDVRQEDRQVGDLTNLIEAGFRQQVGRDDVVPLGAGIGMGGDSR